MQVSCQVHAPASLPRGEEVPRLTEEDAAWRFEKDQISYTCWESKSVLSKS